MKIAIIGVGFVGGTVADFLEQHGHTVVRVDPKYYDVTIPEATADADAAIICVNTPGNPDGSCDGANVLHAYEAIERDIPIMVKSTVTPDIVVNWPETIVTNPEFLREASAAEDFRDQHTFVIGAELLGRENAKFFQDLFQPLLPDCEFITVNRSTASVIKYAHNAWLATKVAWFHELYSALPGEVDYQSLVDTLSRFTTIGGNHMQAPNHEGRLGYSGSCFPKDVSAFNNFINHSILKQVEATNLDLKKKVVASDHVMKELKRKIPKKPFAIFIGTSHTYGECNGEHQDYTFCSHVAKGLGLECVNVGSSGSFNLELLQIVNELEAIDAFNENCRMVFLEPRLTDNTTVVQTENWLPWSVISESIARDNLANTPMLLRTRLGEKQVWFDNQIRHPLTINDYFYIKVQPQQANKEKLKKIASGYYGDENLKKHTDELMLEKSVEFAELRLALEAKNVYAAFADLVIIDAIKNLIVNKGIPFVWMLVDHRKKFLDNLPTFYGRCSNIFDYMLFGDNAKEKMLTYLGHQNISDLDYLHCECHHLNADGNAVLGEMILNELAERNLGI
jgi:hypothetical protein